MKKIHLFSIVIFGIFMLLSCNRELDVAPMPTFDGEANTTIAELVAMHTIGTLDSYDTIPSGTIISGIVTTSDEWGNNYKYINIEDETGGIQIKINNTALYNKYKVGQRVFVKCDGLHIGDYRKLPQLGIWANGSMQPIPNAKTYLYLFTDGAPVNFEPAIVLTSIPSGAQLPSEYVNRLVRLEGATFVEGGIATFSEANASTSHDIKMQDGTTITLRTSNYAKFASTMLPVGTGNITGILTRYNNTVQLVISSLDDLENFSVPQTLQTIFTVNYANAFNDGWQQFGNGTWQTLNNSSFSGFFIANNLGSDTWLVSPAINLSASNSPELTFAHRTPQGFNSADAHLMFTSNFTGNVATTQWTEIPLSASQNATTQIDEVISIPENMTNPNFRFAYKFNGNQSAWYISNIQIKALAK